MLVNEGPSLLTVCCLCLTRWMAEKPTETNQPLTPRGALFLYADYSFPLLMFNISLIVICKCQKAAFVSHVFWTNRPLLLLLVFFLYIIVSCLLFLSVEFMDFWCSSTRWIFFNTFKWPNVPKYTLQKSFQSQWCDRKVPLWCHFFKNKMSVFWGRASSAAWWSADYEAASQGADY